MAPSRRAPGPPDEDLDSARTLAFVNTLYPRPLPAAEERLPSYDALIAWAREQHLLTGAAADRLLAESRRHPQQAAAALARARELREAIHSVLTALESGRRPAPALR